LTDKEKSNKLEVTILNRREVTTFPKLKQPKVSVMVTYVYGDMPPRTITIPKEEHTKESEAKAIRRDMDQQMKIKPETIEV